MLRSAARTIARRARNADGPSGNRWTPPGAFKAASVVGSLRPSAVSAVSVMTVEGTVVRVSGRLAHAESDNTNIRTATPSVRAQTRAGLVPVCRSMSRVAFKAATT